MRCYKCNSVLSETDFCNGCGTDVKIYKKIIRLSNTYYNIGLEKARVRDLSGAAEMLRRSVRANKHNTRARNLLGLVYYEMGECVEAMSEWVISKHFQPEKNLADKYLQDIQSNPTRLEIIEQTAKKYNAALNYANEGSDDLAIVQLKRILTISPNFIRASQLLALLYMKTGEYEKARKVLIKTEKIDKNNTLTIKYMTEIERKLTKENGKPLSKKGKDETERPALSGDDVIIPQVGYREGNSAVINIINILLGIAIGAALVFFLITPARERAVRNEYNDKLSEYSEKIAGNNINVTALEKEIEALKDEKAKLESQVGVQEDGLKKLEIYDQLLKAADMYAKGNYAGCADGLASIKTDGISTEGFKNAYASLKSGSYPQAAEKYYADGDKYMDAKDFDNAISTLLKAYNYNSKDVKIVFLLGRAYRAKNNYRIDDNSRKYFNEVLKLAPGTEYERLVNDYFAKN